MGDQLPGFRFYPTEEELVSFYLYNKLKGTIDLDLVIPVVDIYDYNPWDLPELGGEQCPSDGEQWFFFSLRQEREARGGRPNRLTMEGYWKATGSPSDVYSSQNTVIGRKRTMVFYVGRAPNGTKTTWKMNEYKLAIHSDHQSSSSSSTSQLREEVSLCRIYKKSRSIRAFDRRPHSEAAAATVQEAAAATVQEAAHHHHPCNADNPSSYLSNLQEEPNLASEPGWDPDQFNWFDLPKTYSP